MTDEESAYREAFHDSGYGTFSKWSGFASGSRVFSTEEATGKVDMSVPSLIPATGQLHLNEQPRSPVSESSDLHPVMPRADTATSTQLLRDSLHHPKSELKRSQQPTYLGEPKVSLVLEELLEACEGKKTYNSQKARDELVFYSEKTGVTVVYPVKPTAIGARLERVSVDDCQAHVYVASSVHRDGWIGPVIKVSKRSPLLDFAEMTIPADFSLLCKEEGVAILHAKPSSLSLHFNIDFDVVAAFREDHCYFESEHLKAKYNLEERTLSLKMKEHCLVTTIAKKRNVNIDASYKLHEETIDVKFFVSSVYEKTRV